VGSSFGLDEEPQVVEENIGLGTCWEDLDRDGESSFELHQIGLIS